MCEKRTILSLPDRCLVLYIQAHEKDKTAVAKKKNKEKTTKTRIKQRKPATCSCRCGDALVPCVTNLAIV